MIPKQCIILGGGASIKKGISKQLWKKIKNCFIIGTNYSYLYYPDSTIQTFVDKDFYNERKEQLNELPLIIGKEHQGVKYLPNTIALKCNDTKYYRDIKLGCYKSTLCGIFALSLGIYLLTEGQIFLLGFDYGTINNCKDNKGRRITHFYNDITHRGTGKINYYHTIDRADKDFSPYIKETKCHIYNVSLKSKIKTFSKLSWSGFFEKLDKQQFNQDKLREEIRRKLNGNK